MIISELIKNTLPAGLVFQIQQKKFENQHSIEKKLVIKNAAYKNKHKGERCFILGNGPSINNVDFSLLTNEITFTVNQLPRNKKYPLLNTNYHMWADERFFNLSNDRPEDMELLNIMKEVNTPNNAPIVFYKTSAYDMISKNNLEEELKITYFMDMCRNYTSPEYELAFEKVLPRFPTVVHYLIVLAVYMGFSEIYLLGCDCTGIINTIQSQIDDVSQMVYAYDISDNEKKRMLRSNSTYPIQDELRAYADLFDNYELLHNYCTLRNVTLINATEGSLLNSVPKMHLNEILKRNRKL